MNHRHKKDHQNPMTCVWYDSNYEIKAQDMIDDAVIPNLPAVPATE